MAVWPMLRIQTSKGETPFSRTSAILFATIAIEAKLVLDKKRRKVATFHVVTF